ncbi:hypothetical protein F2Q69_00060725 [Brassica cretica]|uniref:NYN domain-containing protein n=1 Tax=Brassica cretica TaxID=69181 RepID=A0A8S9REY5_BRACR|nr:hypothetical protein F2Q69_00060725 [Brassica cretica]
MLDVSMLVCRVKDGREMKHIRGPVSGEFMYWMNMGHYQKLSDRMIVIMSERKNREDAYAAVILLEISLNKRMSGNDAVKTAKIVAWWDMKDCPIPEGYDARRVRPSIERACKERGFLVLSPSLPMPTKQKPLITTFKRSLPLESLLHIPYPRTRYKLFMAYSVESYKDFFLLRNAIWLWNKLLEEGGGAPLVAGGLSSAMFYCKSCEFDCQSLEKFRKHLSSYKHGREEFTSARWYTRLECVTKTWRRNYRATPEHATAKIQVWWDMVKCPIPEGYDARLIRPSIEASFKKIGYSGPVSITAYADYKETPHHHLVALSSTGVDLAHTLYWYKGSRMYDDVRQWEKDNPAPASVMLISDVDWDDYVPSLFSRYLQESNSNCFLAYSFRPCKMTVCSLPLSGSGKAYLEVFQRKEVDTFLRSAVKVHLRECFIANCESLDEFTKHLSRSKTHAKEVRILSLSLYQ